MYPNQPSQPTPPPMPQIPQVPTTPQFAVPAPQPMQPGQIPQPQIPGSYQQPGYPMPPKKNTGLIIGIVVGAIVLIGVIIAIILVLTMGKNNSSNSTSSNSANSSNSSNSSNKTTTTNTSGTAYSSPGCDLTMTFPASSSKPTETSSSSYTSIYYSDISLKSMYDITCFKYTGLTQSEVDSIAKGSAGSNPKSGTFLGNPSYEGISTYGGYSTYKLVFSKDTTVYEIGVDGSQSDYDSFKASIKLN